jgi:hypothetical protein
LQVKTFDCFDFAVITLEEFGERLGADHGGSEQRMTNDE